MTDLPMHETVLRNVHALLVEEGISNCGMVELGEVNAVATNSSEVEFRAEDGQWYILSIIERNT